MKISMILCLMAVSMNFAFAKYHQPVEIIQNDGKELVIRVSKGIVQKKESDKISDFILYYNIDFNKDLDALPKSEKKPYLKDMRERFTGESRVCMNGTADECAAEAGTYMINLEAGAEWRTIRVPITKRGKFTLHFYRQGFAGRKGSEAVVAQLAGKSSFMKSLMSKSFTFLSGKSKKENKDVAFYPIWKQEIFVQPKNNIKASKIEALAKKYAPISFMHEDEEYLPTSLEYMANIVDKDPKLDEELFQLTLDPVMKGQGIELGRGRKIVFPYKDLHKVLPYNSDSLMVISSTKNKVKNMKTRLRYRKGTAADATVYYSFMINKDLNQAYLNYHFLFPFDPKTGTSENPALPAHTFDRESMTVILDLDTLEPNYVIYGAHLANQTMSLISVIQANLADVLKLQSWKGGRVKFAWNKINKVKGTHPVIVMAQGSHGIYPTRGAYVVTMFGVDTLTEGASGSQILFPNSLEPNKRSKKSSVYKKYAKKTSYKIKNLNLGSITSTSANSFLAFSGDTVDVLGPTNAKFPPYTSREYNIEDYVNGDICSGDDIGTKNCYRDAVGTERLKIYVWDGSKTDDDKRSVMRKEVKVLDAIMDEKL